MATRRDEKGRFLKRGEIEESHGQIAAEEKDASSGGDDSQVSVGKNDLNLGSQPVPKAKTKAKSKGKASSSKSGRGKKNSGSRKGTHEAVAKEESAPSADPESDEIDALERSFEIRLRKGNVADLERFLRKAASNPSGELGRREGRILTVMLKHAYKGSAQHAKLCLDWCKAPPQSKEKEPTQSVAEVLFEKLGFDVADEKKQ